MKRLFLFFSLFTTFMACGIAERDKYEQGNFPETPINLIDFNSTDDDYNSTAPSFLQTMPLVFSSKRGGRTDFNFVQEIMLCSFDRKTGAFSIDYRPSGGLDIVQELTPTGWAAQTANSSANELGPYLLSYEHTLLNNYYNQHYGEYMMLFASDRTGNLDIYLTHNYRPNPTNSSTIPGSTTALNGKTFSNPIPVPFLNSSADDGYPTFDKTFESIYFTSNRAGSFAIYKATLPTISPSELHSILPTLATVPIEPVAEFASLGDTKCPFISSNTVVFTSNRPGGYGGFDLYYSKLTGNKWSAPVNFGPTINSANDEYRPILQDNPAFNNHLMIFSSNRPGGKGGFDLYLVGVPR